MIDLILSENKNQYNKFPKNKGKVIGQVHLQRKCGSKLL